MSVNEIVTAKVYRTLKSIDGAGVKTWNKIAFWTKAGQVETNRGITVEDALGGWRRYWRATDINPVFDLMNTTMFQLVNQMQTNSVFTASFNSYMAASNKDLPVALAGILDIKSSYFTSTSQRAVITYTTYIGNTYERVCSLSDTESSMSEWVSKGLVGTLTLYVSPTGSDVTGNGTSTEPYLTISKAISTVPKDLNGYNVTINIANGTYNEIVTFRGFHGGRFTLNLTPGGTVTLNGYVYFETTTEVIFSGAEANLIINNTSYSNGGLYINVGSILTINQVFVTINGSSTTHGISINGHSGLYANRTITINDCWRAINVFVNSRFYASSLSGLRNIIGLASETGGIISYGSFNIGATTPSLTSNGGFIGNDIATRTKVIVSATAPTDTTAVWIY